MTLTDTSPMPFGKHKGELMANVPASYLLWLHEQPWPRTNEWTALAVRRYIRDNLEAIQQEAKGGGR